jgi:arsenate reductase
MKAASPPRLLARPLAVGERDQLAAALRRVRLPADDVDAEGRLFWRFETLDQVPVGFGGLELHGEHGLLRSLLTLPPARSRGIGRAMVEMIEVEARAALCRHVWLITESAASFFSGLGYVGCERAQVPPAIKETEQFSRLCPASATVMTKHLA